MNMRYVLFMIALLVMNSCAGNRPVVVKTPNIPEGEVAFEFLSEIEQGGMNEKPPEYWEYHPPEYEKDLKLPVYPERPLKDRYGSVEIIVNVEVDSEGSISRIHRISGPTDAYSDDFLQAVKNAVQEWNFKPAEWWYLKDREDLNGDGKADYKEVISRQPASANFDVAFYFEIRDGRGSVRSSTKN